MNGLLHDFQLIYASDFQFVYTFLLSIDMLILEPRTLGLHLTWSCTWTRQDIVPKLALRQTEVPPLTTPSWIRITCFDKTPSYWLEDRISDMQYVAYIVPCLSVTSGRLQLYRQHLFGFFLLALCGLRHALVDLSEAPVLLRSRRLGTRWSVRYIQRPSMVPVIYQRATVRGFCTNQARRDRFGPWYHEYLMTARYFFVSEGVHGMQISLGSGLMLVLPSSTMHLHKSYLCPHCQLLFRKAVIIYSTYNGTLEVKTRHKPSTT